MSSFEVQTGDIDVAANRVDTVTQALSAINLKGLLSIVATAMPSSKTADEIPLVIQKAEATTTALHSHSDSLHRALTTSSTNYTTTESTNGKGFAK